MPEPSQPVQSPPASVTADPHKLEAPASSREAAGTNPLPDQPHAPLRKQERPPASPERELFESRFGPVPYWVLVLLPALAYAIDWIPRVEVALDTLREVGGLSEMIVNLARYIFLASGLTGFSFIMYYIWQEDVKPAKQWLPLAGWTLVLAFVMTFGVLGLFEEFVVSSKIPEALDYYKSVTYERSLTNYQVTQLKSLLVPLKDQIPEFTLMSARDPESLQYASEILTTLNDIGLRLMKDGQRQDRPEAQDLFSTSLRGVIIGVRFPDTPSRPAILLQHALEAARIQAHYVTSSGTAPDGLLILIGPKGP